MGKETTIKVNFAPGSMEAFEKGAKQAEKAGVTAKESAAHTSAALVSSANMFETKLSDIAKGQINKKSKTSVAGAIETGLEQVAGGGGAFKWIAAAAAAAATIGKGASDLQMFGSGPMLRGHGLSGMIHGVGDLLTGRSTREGLQDFKLMQQDFYTDRLSNTMERLFQRQTNIRESQFRPLTEVDPLTRQKMEMNRVQAHQDMVKADMEKAQVRFALERGDMAKGRFMGMRVGAGGAFVDEVGELKSKIAEDKAMISYKMQLKDLAKQELELTSQQYQSKKESLREGRLGFGGLTPMEQQFAIRSAQRLRSGETLAPEELSSLKGLGGVASDTVNKYLSERGDKGGYNELVSLIGDPSMRKAAQQSVEVGGTIEINLDLNKQSERAFQAFQKVTKRLEEEVDLLNARVKENELIMHNKVTIDRKLQVPGGK